MYKKIWAFVISLSMLLLLLNPITVLGLGDNPPNSPTEPAFESISVSANSHTAGTMQAVTISVTTKNVLNATTISAQLTDSSGVIPVEGIDTASSTINANTASISLSLPAGTPAGNYKIKVNIASLNISDSSTVYTILAGAQTSITTVVPEPASHTSGNAQTVNVKVNTNNTSNGTPVTAQLIDSSDTAVANVSVATGIINNNYASINLSIPGNIAAGSYKIRTTVLMANYEVPYTINSQSNNPAISRVSLSNYSNTYGAVGSINVTIDTSNVANNAAVSVDLVEAQNTANVVAGVPTSAGNVNNNTTSIPLSIPASVGTGNYKIKVTVDGVQNPDTSQNYSVVLPELMITNISTTGASLAQNSISGNLSISGTNFSSTASQNTVQIVNTSGVLVKNATQPLSASTSSLTVAIPTDLQQGTYKVKITVGGQSKVSTKTFTVTAPLPAITGVATEGASLVEGSISGSMSVSGSNFGSNPTDNTLALVKDSTETLCTITSSTTTGLRATLPTNLTEGTYTVKVSVGGASVTYAGFNVTKPEIPAAPADLSNPTVTSNTVAFNWNAVLNAAAYHVYRSTNNIDFTKITSSPIKATTYSDSGLTAGTTYYYKISAVNAGGESPRSNALTSVTLTNTPAIPSAGTITLNSIELNWTSVPGAQGYCIYMSSSPSGTYSLIGSTSANTLTYNNSGLNHGTTYYYKITAKNSAGVESYYSPVFNVATKTEAGIPNAPTATNITKTSVQLNWISVENTTSYNIYRSTMLGSGYVKLNTTPIVGTSYTDSTLTANMKYYFKVTAINDSGESAKSPELEVSTGTSEIISYPTPSIPVINQDDKEKIEPVIEGSTAKLEFTTELVNEVFAKALSDKNGVKTASIELDKIDGVKEYAIELPTELFNKTTLSQKIEISTPIGTITLPDTMFSNSKVTAVSKVEVSLSLVDTSKLSSKVKKAIGKHPIIELNALVDGKAIAWDNPDAPVIISMSYTPTVQELKKPEHIVVSYIDGTGKITTVPSGKYNPVTKKITFTTTHFSQYAVNYVYKTFKDISKLTAKKSIEVMYSKGIVAGTSKNTFSPKKDISRGDFILYLVNALGLTAEVDSNFSDVKPTDAYYNAIGIAKELKIISSVGKNKFNPKQPITREDAAVIIVKAMKAAKMDLSEVNLNNLKKYNDYKKIDSYAKDSFSILMEEGVYVWKGKTLNPKEFLTREEIAAIVYRIYNK